MGGNMQKPLIGVTPLYDRGRDSYWMLPGYFLSLEEAGAVPVMLPLLDDEAVLRRLVDTLDGFLMTGGPDAAPAYYGEARHPLCGEPSEKRDRFELALLRELIRLKRPVFGICRGIQVMNVALGGTLWQDIGAQLLTSPHLAEGADLHTVYVSGSLAELFGKSEIQTNSFHHQAVGVPGAGLKVLARSRDGVIEAVAHESLPFYRAVQWHPEMRPDDAESKKLIASFLKAARDERA